MKKIGKYIVWIVALAAGVLLGLLIGSELTMMWEQDVDFLTSMVVLYLIVYVVLYLNVIIHESGHLLFGLLTGYKFSSFRIQSFMWMRDESGKLRLKRFKLLKTGGQCLMEPPELVNGKMPTVLYNMGGAILNLVSSALCFGLWAIMTKVCGYRGVVTMFLMALAVCGVYSAMANGIPLHIGMIDNDGMNALMLRQNPRAVRGIWMGLKYSAMQVCGKGIMDVPEDWLEMPSDEDLKNAHAAWPSGLIVDRLIAEHRFEEAAALIDHLLEADTALVDLVKIELRKERIFCECMCGRDPEKLGELRTKKQLKYMKATKDQPSTIRAEYAYALLVEKDADKANKLKEQHARAEKKYPYADVLRIDRELMQLAEEMREI